MNRTLNVVRLQFVNKQTYLWIPLVILLGGFALSLLVFSLVSSDGPMYAGAAMAPLTYFVILGARSLTLTFPFSQAVSLTRREFYLGTLAAATLSAAVLATVVVIGARLEQVTHGFGTNGYTFQLPFLTERGWLVTWFGYVVGALFLFVIGFWTATVYLRFGALVLVLAALGTALLAVIGVWLVTRADGWASVGRWFVDQGATGLTGWAVAITLVLAASSYLTLRRATP